MHKGEHEPDRFFLSHMLTLAENQESSSNPPQATAVDKKNFCLKL